MTLTAEECCRTVGCNCAGTQMIEHMNFMPWWAWMILCLIPALLIEIYVVYLIKNHKEDKNDKTNMAGNAK